MNLVRSTHDHPPRPFQLRISLFLCFLIHLPRCLIFLLLLLVPLLQIRHHLLLSFLLLPYCMTLLLHHRCLLHLHHLQWFLLIPLFLFIIPVVDVLWMNLPTCHLLLVHHLPRPSRLMVFGLDLALLLTAILLANMAFRLYLSLPLIVMLLFILNGSL